VFDVLLGLFDEGRLTDRFGRTTNFTSSLIVMTSNLGGTDRSAVGFTPVEASYAAEVESFFRPELFNRIDDLVVFHRLTDDVLRAIAEKELRELAEREGVAKRGLRVEWTAAPLARHLVANPRLRGRLLLDFDSTGAIVIARP
jgi:ATP-dependent Clp protease ATP-binding subunit ClpC